MGRLVAEFFPNPHDQQERRHDNCREHRSCTEDCSKKDPEKRSEKIIHEWEEVCRYEMNFTIDYAPWKMFLCFVERMLLTTFFDVVKRL